MDRGAWWAIVRGIGKSQTQLRANTLTASVCPCRSGNQRGEIFRLQKVTEVSTSAAFPQTWRFSTTYVYNLEMCGD